VTRLSPRSASAATPPAVPPAHRGWLLAALAVWLPMAGAGPIAPGERLTYRFYWNGIPVGEVCTLVRKHSDPQAIELALTAGTNAGIDKLYRFRLRWLTVASKDGFRASRVTVKEEENSRRSHYLTTFDRKAGTVKSVKTRLDKDSVRNYSFETRTAYDAIGVLYAVRAGALKPGQTLTYEAITGRRLYRLKITVGARERVKVAAGAFDALRLTVQGKRIQPPEKPKEPTPALQLWVADSPGHVPVKLSIRTRWASVWGELVQATAPATQAAKKAARK